MAGTKTAVSKAEKVSKKIDEKPVKKERKPRAPTAYNNFIKHFYAEFAVPDGEEKPKPKEMIAMAAAEWKKLTDDEKAEYKSSANSDTEEATDKEPEKPKKAPKKEATVKEAEEDATEKPKKSKKKEAKVTERVVEEATDKEPEEEPKKEKKSKKSKKPAKEGLITTSESEKEDI